MVDPLITSGIDPALLRVLEKRGESREDWPRRKRAPVTTKTGDENRTENETENGIESEDADTAPDAQRHTLDDLA